VIYLDHAATSPLLPAAAAAWQRASQLVGNPSSPHGLGRTARRVVEESRENLAQALGVAPGDVIFTSGGTEADNLAVLGLARGQRAADPNRRRVLVGATEHHAVLDPARHLRDEGFEVVELPVGHDGLVDVDDCRRRVAVDPATVALVSLMAVNNETGTIQPTADLVELAREYGVLYHCDAVQAVGYLDWSGRPPDAFSLSAHKLGGPVGVGALVARPGLPLVPIAFGGGQERRVRSGTLPAALIAGFAAALEQTARQRIAERARLRRLSDRLIAGLVKLPGVTVVGPTQPEQRSPHIVQALFENCLGDDLLLLLDAAGIACAVGAACTAGVTQTSHVLLAMGYSDRQASGGLRFSFGSSSQISDVETCLAVLPEALARARQASGAWGEGRDHGPFDRRSLWRSGLGGGG